MNYINLATTDSSENARALGAKLGEHGVETLVIDEGDLQKFVFCVKQPKAFTIVQVHEEDYAQAVHLVQQWQQEGDPLCAHLFSCPECSSLAVEYPQYTRKFFITPFLAEMLVSLGLFEKEFYCRKCNWTWKSAKAGVTRKFANSEQVLVAPHE